MGSEKKWFKADPRMTPTVTVRSSPYSAQDMKVRYRLGHTESEWPIVMVGSILECVQVLIRYIHIMLCFNDLIGLFVGQQPIISRRWKKCEFNAIHN
jgi:hypothetical protein